MRRGGRGREAFSGAFYVAASIVLNLRLGAATTIGFVISGQVLASILLDQFGLLNLPVHPVTFPKLGGAVLIVVGAIIVLAPDHKPLWFSNFTLFFMPARDYIGGGRL